MSWYELWLFLHVTAAIVWIGGAATIQVFGVRTKRAADPAKTVLFARNVSWTIMNVFLPAALLVFVSGVGLTVNGDWDWGEPFIVFGLVAGIAVSLVAFGFLGKALGAAGARLEAEGPSPRSVFASETSSGSRASCLAVLLAIVFMMTVKLGT